MTTMKYYIFKNRRNGNIVCGTDFNFSPPRQILCSYWDAPLIVPSTTLEYEVKRRHISTKTYNVVEVMLVDVKGVIL